MAGNSSNFYVHPDIYLTSDRAKGTGTASRVDLKAGTLTFIDNPYALVPTVALASDIHPLCSSLQCSRKVVHSPSTVTCPRNCSTDVVWCNSHCRELSNAEHEFECAWLKAHATSIRREVIEEDFYTIWLIVRILAQRHLESTRPMASSTHGACKTDDSFTSNWNVFDRLRSNQDPLQPLKLESWRKLIKKYLVGKHTMLQHPLDVEEMLTLMCRVEINHYDLWPNPIGIWPLPSKVERGSSGYAYAMYLRTPFLNHSCVPNLMHQPDEDARMVFHTARKVTAGEEFSLAYFDLADPKYIDVKQRRAYLESEFRFHCVCARCVAESGEIKARI